MSTLRDEILATEERAWRELHDATATLPDDLWLKPGVNGGGTIKDLIAHVGCWSAEAARQLECIRSGAPSRGPEAQAFNGASYEACKDLTIHEAVAMASAAHHRLREEIELVAPVALSGKIVEMLHECADRHYREHLAQLRLFLQEGSA